MSVWTIWEPIGFGAAMTFLLLTALRICRGEPFVNKSREGYFVGVSPFKGLTQMDVFVSFMVGVVVGLVDYVAYALNYDAKGWAFACAGVLVFIWVCVIARSLQAFGVADSIVFIGIYVVLYLVTKAVMRFVVTGIMNYGWRNLWLLMPLLMLIVSIGIEVVTFFYSMYCDDDTDSNMRGVAAAMTVVSAIAALTLAIIFVAVPVIQGFNGGSDPGPDPDPEVQWHFYNNDIQHDGLDNDYNFGPTPSGAYPEGMDYESVSSYNVTIEAAPYFATLIAEMSVDPVKGTGIVAAHDKLLNQQMVGYVWNNDAELNNIVVYFVTADPAAYYTMHENFFREVKERASVYLYNFPQGTLTSQEYQNPYTTNGIPALVIADSHDRGGLALVIEYNTGEQLILRIACDFQPCNLVNVPVSSDPYEPQQTTTAYNPPTEPATTAPQPTTTVPEPTAPQPTEPETTTPTPTQPETTTPQPTEPPTQPPTTYNKDPEKASYENVEPNDNPGPGNDTNNGVNAQYSTKDLPSNSNHMTYEQYTQAIGELESVNEAQKTGGDNNKPSYTPPTPVANTDNNGDTGNNGAPINAPTPTKAPATAADTGSAISTQPAGVWDDSAMGF